MLRILTLCSLLWCMSLPLVEAQTTHPCSDNNVDHSTPPLSIEQKIKLAKLPHTEKLPLDAKSISPQQIPMVC